MVDTQKLLVKMGSERMWTIVDVVR